MIGLQSRYDDIGRVGLYSTEARQVFATTREDRVRQSSVGVFAQNVTQWTSWVRSIAGLRFDYYNFDVRSSLAQNSGRTSDSLGSPKLGLIFGPWAKTEYFVNAGYGFHSNDARGTLIHVDPKDPTVGVEPVTPLVRTKGAELGVRTEIIPNLQSSLALWMLNQDSELLFTGDAGTTEASRPSERRGVEWINYWRPRPWLLVDGELAFTRARFSDFDPAGDRIPGALERMAQLGVTVTDLGRWYGALQLRYFGSYPLIEDNSVRADSTTIVNGRVGYLLTPNLRLHLDVLNLFNSTRNDISYYYPSCLRNEVGTIPQCTGPNATGVNDIHFHPVEPRQFRVSLIAYF
jgi:outer membrane receptor protein involved in Fe transport